VYRGYCSQSNRDLSPTKRRNPSEGFSNKVIGDLLEETQLVAFSRLTIMISEAFSQRDFSTILRVWFHVLVKSKRKQPTLPWCFSRMFRPSGLLPRSIDDAQGGVCWIAYITIYLANMSDSNYHTHQGGSLITHIVLHYHYVGAKWQSSKHSTQIF
jgi:hypothetical protein